MTQLDGTNSDDKFEPVIKEYEGFGELVIGTSDKTKVIVTALCMLDHPQVNQYFLDNKLKMVDRITKTRIFPREGMSLPGGEVFHLPEVETSTENENDS